jgi:hypothetical protein
MFDNFVEATIRRLNIRALLISLAGLLVVFIGLAINTRYLYNMFLGPFPLLRFGDGNDRTLLSRVVNWQTCVAGEEQICRNSK